MIDRHSKQIGIIGNGMVGSTLATWFDRALIYDIDPERSPNSLSELNEQSEIIFVAVPTPFNDQFDLSLVEKAVDSIEGSKAIVIKSTVLPGTTTKLQQKYDQHQFIFNPEFLTEKTAKKDFLHPKMQLVGYTNQSQKIAPKILQLLPTAPLSKILKAEEAEAVKYFRNTFYATKVVFANQFFDFCQNTDLDYEVIKEIVKQDPMVGPNHLEIFHQGGRGAGGKCLAKDLAAFSNLTKTSFFNFINKLNQEYLNETNKPINSGE